MLFLLHAFLSSSSSVRGFWGAGRGSGHQEDRGTGLSVSVCRVVHTGWGGVCPCRCHTRTPVAPTGLQASFPSLPWSPDRLPHDSLLWCDPGPSGSFRGPCGPRGREQERWNWRLGDLTPRPPCDLQQGASLSARGGRIACLPGVTGFCELPDGSNHFQSTYCATHEAQIGAATPPNAVDRPCLRLKVYVRPTNETLYEAPEPIFTSNNSCSGLGACQLVLSTVPVLWTLLGS
ncbi:ephrin-A2 isoform X1 [Felis catus]|uniref:ephrin-A2 isoform X1 n=1 Tax=Felis catus TaxID=9685 RepID=UPI001D19D5D0|nr:ephrin-A2 isoform X1 [Felis catus]